MPPYEWYNKKVVHIASQLDQITVNFSSGTRSNADYTTPDMPNYISSNDILESIYSYLSLNSMNGFHLLIHPGTSPRRKDKFYLHLDQLISKLKKEGYQFFEILIFTKVDQDLRNIKYFLMKREITTAQSSIRLRH